MQRILKRVVDIRPNEVRAAWLGFLFFFIILAGYYVIRPIRDSIGASNFENLQWMITAVLVAMIAANALFSTVVSRLPRRRFIPLAYRFFAINLLFFFALMRVVPPGQQPWVDGSFFIWVSVFNLFNTAIFWGFMTDLFTSEQGKRLFGFIAIGGSLGAILGPGITTFLAQKVSPGWMLLISAAMFELAAQSIRFFPEDFRRPDEPARAEGAAEEPMGGRFWDGVIHVCRSPYLSGLLIFIMLYTLTSTWTYFQQSDLTRTAFADKGARTAFFAKLDLVTNTLTLLLQLFLTGRFMKSLGVTFTLLFMPVLSLFGFVAIGARPDLAMLAIFQVARRASTFAFMRPSREVLFTVLRRADKYKAKSFIDTFGYRLGDQVGTWTYVGLRALHLSLTSISYLAVPVVAVWCVVGLWLGRKQHQLAEAKSGQGD